MAQLFGLSEQLILPGSLSACHAVHANFLRNQRDYAADKTNICAGLKRRQIPANMKFPHPQNGSSRKLQSENPKPAAAGKKAARLRAAFI